MSKLIRPFCCSKIANLKSCLDGETEAMKEGERGPFFPKLRVRIKDNNSSPHGKFYRFLFPFSSKFSDLNFALYVLYIYLHTVSLGYLWFYLPASRLSTCLLELPFSPVWRARDLQK